jgi:hypothetical protein
LSCKAILSGSEISVDRSEDFSSPTRKKEPVNRAKEIKKKLRWIIHEPSGFLSSEEICIKFSRSLLNFPAGRFGFDSFEVNIRLENVFVADN